MMRFEKMITLLVLVLLPSLADAQLFKRRYNNCPDNNCQPYSSPSPNHPTITPVPESTPAPVDTSSIDFVEIPTELMVRNVNGNCVWCTTEPIWVTAGYEAFRGITERAIREGWHGATVDNVISACKDAKVPYKVVTNGDMSIFKYAKEEGVGVYVQVMVNRPDDHAVAVVGMNDTHVRILDNNGPRKIQTWTMERFKRVWGGVACCPLLNKHKKKPNNPTVPPETKPAEPSKPAEPKPVEPAKPVEPGCKCPPPQDLSKITDGLGKLVESVSAVNNNVGIVNKSVNDLSTKVGNIDQRLVIVEGKMNEKPPVVTVPDPNIKTVQDKLQKLEDAIRKQSGTLRISVTPK